MLGNYRQMRHLGYWSRVGRQVRDIASKRRGGQRLGVGSEVPATDVFGAWGAGLCEL